jgi:thiol-disulfide isomerase/thioredoxin
MRARELFGDFWLNGDPVSINMLRGCVVLLDFWEYTSVSCLQGIPYVNEWQERYGGLGFQAIGVHSPQYNFAKNADRVAAQITRLGVRYPVVLDNDGILWGGYGARERPARFVVDMDGFLRFMYEGSGGYDQLERWIQSLLNEGGLRGEMPEFVKPKREIDVPGAVLFRATNDIPMGYLRGTLGNLEAYSPESSVDYVDQELYVQGRVYAKGTWMQEREFLRFEGKRGEIGSLTARYEGAEVHLAVDPLGKESIDISVMQDGKNLTEEIAGDDIMFTKSGESLLRVGEGRAYQIVKNQGVGEHVVRLRVSSSKLEFYELSFVSAVIPEFASG